MEETGEGRIRASSFNGFYSCTFFVFAGLPCFLGEDRHRERETRGNSRNTLVHTDQHAPQREQDQWDRKKWNEKKKKKTVYKIQCTAMDPRLQLCYIYIERYVYIVYLYNSIITQCVYTEYTSGSRGRKKKWKMNRETEVKKRYFFKNNKQNIFIPHKREIYIKKKRKTEKTIQK